MNGLCDDLGLDTISTGGIVAYMMEMTEKESTILGSVLVTSKGLPK